MKTITAYECEFCKKILKTKRAMKSHEFVCFKNTASKSCITCKSLGRISLANGRRLTDSEEALLRHDVEGSFNVVGDEDGNMHHLLKDNYKYLYELDQEDYCSDQDIILCKLRTNCNCYNCKL